MKVHLTLPTPHSKIQNLIMQFPTFKVDKAELWVAAGTKFGKSLSAATAISSQIFVGRQRTYRWIAPIYHQSMIGMKYCNRLLPGTPVTKQNNSDYSISVPAFENVLQFMHAQNPEVLEGEAVAGQIFDEASKMKEGAYHSGQTTQTFTKGWSIFISTTRGRNWFYHNCMAAKEEMEADLKAGRTPRRYFVTAPTWANPGIAKETIEAAKRTLPDRLFRQYYGAEFVEDGSIFLGFRQSVYCTVPDLFSQVQKWFHSEASKASVVVGVDWAKTTDFTVFTAWENYNGKFRCIGLMRFQGEKYQKAIQNLYFFCSKFKTIDLIQHDKTGIGQVIDDLLDGFAHPVEGVVFSAQSKSYLINTTASLIEQERIMLPGWEPLLEEFESFEVVLNSLGHMKYSAPAGMHDDIVISCCLGITAASELYGTTFATTNDFSSPDSTTDSPSWYSEFDDDLNDDEI